MLDYAIGDIQGCFEPLLRLLDHIHFNEHAHRLWFVGDLVNRGPQSLEVLRFIKNLPLAPRITLGNHDLYLLSKFFAPSHKKEADDTLEPILRAEDGEELAHWLCQQSILYHDKDLNVVMCHAGIAPVWHLDDAKKYAAELEQVLRSGSYETFFLNMYGNTPNYWNNHLQGMTRLRLITNYFTRMRFCDKFGGLLFDYNGPLAQAPEGYLPWYAVPNRMIISESIVFGHWAALEEKHPNPNCYALDTGCVWGGPLTALRLQDKAWFSVQGLREGALR